MKHDMKPLFFHDAATNHKTMPIWDRSHDGKHVIQIHPEMCEELHSQEMVVQTDVQTYRRNDTNIHRLIKNKIQTKFKHLHTTNKFC